MLKYALRNRLPCGREILVEPPISDAEGGSISKVFPQYFYLISTVFLPYFNSISTIRKRSTRIFNDMSLRAEEQSE